MIVEPPQTHELLRRASTVVPPTRFPLVGEGMPAPPAPTAVAVIVAPSLRKSSRSTPGSPSSYPSRQRFGGAFPWALRQLKQSARNVQAVRDALECLDVLRATRPLT